MIDIGIKYRHNRYNRNRYIDIIDIGSNIYIMVIIDLGVKYRHNRYIRYRFKIKTLKI